MDERSEAELVEEARRGGREAFAELVRRHERRIHGVVYRMAGNHSDADDLAQEAFLTAWKAIGSFRVRIELLHLALPDRRQRLSDAS
ncbi:MAG: hypothetical protein M0C28_43005 [Candidatus Moduliflexus flocculans]|nr:hypothetical protein [Candidatus Moduliflexus flocculans]